MQLGKVSLDGTKIKANASKQSDELGACQQVGRATAGRGNGTVCAGGTGGYRGATIVRHTGGVEASRGSTGGDCQAKAEIERRAQVRDEAERAAYEEKLARRRKQEKETGKKTGGRPPQAPTPGPRKQDQVNFTDEESRIMPSTEGFVQGYNAQAAVDVDSHMVVTNHVTAHCNDKQEVAPTLQHALPDAVGKPDGLLADAGYFSQDNVARCEAEDVTPYISFGREQHHQSLAERCEPVPECPPDADAVTRMQHRLKTPDGKAVYARRKSTVETVFGIVKEVMGFRRFHVRGLEAVNGEWTLTCLAWNLKRMHALA